MNSSWYYFKLCLPFSAFSCFEKHEIVVVVVDSSWIRPAVLVPMNGTTVTAAADCVSATSIVPSPLLHSPFPLLSTPTFPFRSLCQWSRPEEEATRNSFAMYSGHQLPDNGVKGIPRRGMFIYLNAIWLRLYNAYPSFLSLYRWMLILILTVNIGQNWSRNIGSFFSSMLCTI